MNRQRNIPATVPVVSQGMNQASNSKTASTKPLRVGIVGASAERGWAKISHVPAVQALAGLELEAVASGSPAKGEAAAKAFGAKTGYADARDLVRDPAVDIVTVAVKVPDHREVVMEAIAAGKHVYCEWPLGRNLAETEEMAAAAHAAGVHVAIGLQTRQNPAARRFRELLDAGAIGRILSARVESTTMAFGPAVEAAMAFGEEADNGVTLITIQGAHTLDFAVATLGGFADLSALATTQYPEVHIGDDVRSQRRTTPDHLLVQSRLRHGGALTIEVAGGRLPDAVPFRLEVTGDKGTLMLKGGAPRGFQSGRLQISLDGQSMPVDEGELAALPDTAANVAGVYAALRDDILFGTSTVPDFHHAVRLAHLVDAVLSSAATGARLSAHDWPA